MYVLFQVFLPAACELRDKDGNVVPKKNTLAAYKSGIRMEVNILDNYRSIEIVAQRGQLLKISLLSIKKSIIW